MRVRYIKPLGPKLERAHLDNDHPYKHIPTYERDKENNIRHKRNKKLANRRKNKGK